VVCETFKVSASKSAEGKGCFSSADGIWISRSSIGGLPDRDSSCQSARPCQTYWHQRWTLRKREAASPNYAESRVCISLRSVPSLSRKRMITLSSISMTSDVIPEVHHDRLRMTFFASDEQQMKLTFRAPNEHSSMDCGVCEIRTQIRQSICAPLLIDPPICLACEPVRRFRAHPPLHTLR
jgi:hypothetical protein